MVFLKLNVARRIDPIRLNAETISLDYQKQGGAPSVTVELDRAATDKLVESLTEVTAGFGDGYGSWVSIEAIKAAGMVAVRTQEPNGTIRYTRFLPHERDKVIRAFHDAFDAIS